MEELHIMPGLKKRLMGNHFAPPCLGEALRWGASQIISAHAGPNDELDIVRIRTSVKKPGSGQIRRINCFCFF
jgi:hypothetical protein